ncbi:MAG: methyltransferase domain-containing protein [Actinomycetota bacterium]
MTPSELAARLAAGWTPTLLDVRTALEWRQERIPGFQHRSLLRALRVNARGPTVVACRSGHRAQIAAGRMRGEVYVLDGGVKAWEKAGLPIERGKADAVSRLIDLVDLLGFRRWRRRIASGARGLVMELGAGNGRNAAFYRPGVRLVAVEPDPEALRALQSGNQAKGAFVVCARAEALPFRDNVFDTTVVTLVFCSVDDPDRAATELARTLKDDGEVRGAEHVLARGLLGRLLKIMAPSWHRMTGSCRIDRTTMETFARAGLQPTVRARRRGHVRCIYGNQGRLNRFLEPHE